MLGVLNEFPCNARKHFAITEAKTKYKIYRERIKELPTTNTYIEAGYRKLENNWKNFLFFHYKGINSTHWIIIFI
jgi:hypothetical protein